MFRLLFRKLRQKLSYNKYNLEWKKRIKDVIISSDNSFIPRVKNAGKITGGFQIMHNGIKILKGSYYGIGITKMLVKNKGVHEPQEERVFREVLGKLKIESTIVELGSYWGFYSMWFLKENKNGRAFLFEPELSNLNYGIENFKLNNFQGDFNHAYIGKTDKNSNPPTFTIDSICEKKNISFIDILHSDIQGYEYEMLLGAKTTIENSKIGYVFISTHSNELHAMCLSFLQKRNFLIICECNLDETYSVDGLIVARLKTYIGVDPIEISKKG